MYCVLRAGITLTEHYDSGIDSPRRDEADMESVVVVSTNSYALRSASSSPEVAELPGARSVQLHYKRILDLCRYVWWCMPSSLPADLLIVYVMSAYLGRCERAERARTRRRQRAHQRWEIT